MIRVVPWGSAKTRGVASLGARGGPWRGRRQPGAVLFLFMCSAEQGGSSVSMKVHVEWAARKPATETRIACVTHTGHVQKEDLHSGITTEESPQRPKRTNRDSVLSMHRSEHIKPRENSTHQVRTSWSLVPLPSKVSSSGEQELGAWPTPMTPATQKHHKFEASKTETQQDSGSG